MPTEHPWRAVRFEEISTGIYDGPHATPPRAESGRVFLRIDNINRGGLDLTDIRWIADADWAKWTRRVTPQADDIVFSYEANLGLFARIPDGFNGCLGRRLALIRPDKSKVDPKYLLYATLSPQFQAFLQSRTVHGSTVDRISLKEFPTYEIPLPSLTEQRAIAGVLGSLDDKIELNRRMSGTLEAMARALFKSWFVDFDPVHANAAGQPTLPPDLAALFPAEFEPSELGDVPKGWIVESFSKHLSAVRGLSYKGSGLCDESEGLPLHNLNSIYEGGGYKHVGIKFYNGSYREKHVVKPGDMIIPNTEQGHEHRLIGYAAIVPERFGESGLFSHHIYRITPQANSPLTRHYLCHLFNTSRCHSMIAGYSNGTSINMLPLDAMTMPLLVVPPRKAVGCFDALAQQVHIKFERAEAESRTLAALRDALLPKLLSGELSVADAMAEVPA